MTIAFFSTLPFEQTWFQRLRDHHQITFIPEALTADTVRLAGGHQAVCAFVNDDLSRSHPKVLLTAHQGFLTEEALRQIVRSLLNQFSFYANQHASLTTKASLY